jgi:hypothetical protein
MENPGCIQARVSTPKPFKLSPDSYYYGRLFVENLVKPLLVTERDIDRR